MFEQSCPGSVLVRRLNHSISSIGHIDEAVNMTGYFQRLAFGPLVVPR